MTSGNILFFIRRPKCEFFGRENSNTLEFGALPWENVEKEVDFVKHDFFGVKDFF